MKLTKKAVDAMIKSMIDRVQFNVMDLGKVSAPPHAVRIAGGTEDEARAALAAAIAKYRKN